MQTVARIALRTTLALLAFAVAGAFLLSGTQILTAPIINASEEKARNAMIAEVLPPGSFDNDLQQSRITLPPSDALGSKSPSNAYQARKGGKTVGVVFESIAPDGYSGNIYLLVGVMADGSLAGVRVTDDKETPGLGDYIELAKSNWIKQFDGKSLSDPTPDNWKVKKDGGVFAYYAGATISPRAVVKAVKLTLQYFGQHKAALLAQNGGHA